MSKTIKFTDCYGTEVEITIEIKDEGYYPEVTSYKQDGDTIPLNLMSLNPTAVMNVIAALVERITELEQTGIVIGDPE